jgi:2-methylcitrate dehydratase PrpD
VRLKDLDGNEKVSLFIKEVNWDNLPAEVRKRTLVCLLDNLGVTLAGTLTPISRIAAGYAAENWCGDAATILVHNLKASAPGAAFANASAANALDLDDDAIYTRGHPGAQLFPAVLAVAEKAGASGKELLESLVVGYEVSIRAGRCWHDLHEVYQSCGSWGSLGCAAAAAHLLKLDLKQISNALGIAEYYSPNAPMMRDIYNPTMVKHAIGWGAMNGVTSALLAQKGYTGMPSLLGMDKYKDWISDLGEVYWMADWVFHKEWASCAWGHAAGVAALRLLDEHNIEPAQIKGVRVKTFGEAVSLYQGYPSTTEEAQFSVKWPLACLIIDRELGPDQVLEKRFSDTQVRALFDKIEMIVDPEVNKLYEEMKEMDLRMHSAVEITLQDGRVFDSGIVERGADRYSDEDLEKKFRKLAAFVTEPGTAEKLVDLVRNFDRVKNMHELIDLIM